MAVKNEKKIVRNNLKAIRNKVGMSVYDLMQKADIKYSQEYYKYESGKTNFPHVNKAIKIAKALGVKVEDIWPVK